MTRWARLTWQSADPAALAADLGRRLGVAAGKHGTIPGAFVLPLGVADLELVPWRREGPSDHPQAAGRLVFEPIEDGAPDQELIRPPSLLLAGIAWATVELDRAEAELETWIERSTEPRFAEDGDEPHLGARVRARATSGLPVDILVLAEPTTEGRLAASLARDGEGPCALYLCPSRGVDAWVRDARRRGVTISTIQTGPFGRSVLIPGAAPAGPFVIMVERRLPSSIREPPGTIAP